MFERSWHTDSLQLVALIEQKHANSETQLPSFRAVMSKLHTAKMDNHRQEMYLYVVTSTRRGIKTRICINIRVALRLEQPLYHSGPFRIGREGEPIVKVCGTEETAA